MHLESDVLSIFKDIFIKIRLLLAFQAIRIYLEIQEFGIFSKADPQSFSQGIMALICTFLQSNTQ